MTKKTKSGFIFPEDLLSNYLLSACLITSVTSSSMFGVVRVGDVGHGYRHKASARKSTPPSFEKKEGARISLTA